MDGESLDGVFFTDWLPYIVFYELITIGPLLKQAQWLSCVVSVSLLCHCTSLCLQLHSVNKSIHSFVYNKRVS